MTIKKLLSIIVGLAIFVLLVISGYFVYNKFFVKKEVLVDLQPSNYTNLWSDKNYADAEDLLASGKTREALGAYEHLLATSTSTDPVVRSQMAVRIATLYDASGDYNTAVDKLFTLIDDKDSYFITKAFAYEYLARMVYDRKNDAIYSRIVQKLNIATNNQSDEKYSLVATFLLQKSIDTAPLYLAISKKNYIESESYNGNISKDKKESYLNSLRQTDSMISDMASDPNAGYMVPLALLRKAQVIENIYSPGFTKEAPEFYYEKALDAYNKAPQARSYNYVYYEYARYLAVSGGDKNKDKIIELLAHYKNPTDEAAHLKEYLSQIQKSPTSKQAREYNALNKIQKVEIQ